MDEDEGVRQEPFDVVSVDGEPTGRVKPRWQVHRDGDWHRSFHCWVAWREAEGQTHLLVQRRGATKDVAANLLDVAVGGHFRAGERLADVVREVEEELGLPARLDDLVPIGRRRAAYEEAGVVDREIQEVFVYALPKRPSGLRVEPSEIDALYVLTAEAIEAVFGAESVDCEAAAVRPDGSLGPFQPAVVSPGDFVPVHDDYWRRAAGAAARVLAGARDVDLGLWTAGQRRRE